jgi:hypothetical protein
MLKAYHQFILYDKDNRLIKKSRKRKSRSFVKQFSKSLYSLLANIQTSAFIKDTSGTTKNCGEGSYMMYSAQVGGTTWISNYLLYSGESYTDSIGIILGTSNQAVSIDDFKLITPIVNGISATQLEYLNCGVTEAIINAGTNTGTFTVDRIFRNNSGNTISIQEIGLYSWSGYLDYNYYYYPICMLRDIVSPAFDITNGEYLKATYTFSITA